MNCNICDKSFTGLVCFQQHEASEKHKNKVKLFQMRATNGNQQMPSISASSIDSQVIRCDTCEVNFIGLSNFQKHVNSLQHVGMVKKKNESSASEDQLNCSPGVSEYEFTKETNPGSCMSFNSPIVNPVSFAECEACNKKFSGPEPYQQHLASETHKKKSIRNQFFGKKPKFDTVDSDKIVPFVKQEGNASSEKGVSGTIELFAKCSFCNMIFSGPEPYQLHVDSEGHKRKVGINLNSNIVKPFAQCSFCNMEFSGPEPYQLHVDSEDHQRKVAINHHSNMQNSGNHNKSLSPFRCDVCDKDFSGPIPYNDHMISKVHKKKIQNVEFLKNIRSPTALQSDCNAQVPDYLMQQINADSDVGNQAWYCEVCKKPSTGPIPHQMHLASEGHRKNTRAMEMEKILKMKRESLMQHHFENELKKENLNELSREDQISSSPNNNYNDKGNEVFKDFYISKDLILCDALKNIGVIPEEDLNVTIFYPDEEIVFA